MSEPTQKASVLRALQGGPRTTLELIRLTNCCCVTKRLSELRRDGWEIVSSEKRVAGRRIVTYELKGQLSLRLGLFSAPSTDYVRVNNSILKAVGISLGGQSKIEEGSRGVSHGVS